MLQQKIGRTKCPTKVVFGRTLANFDRPLSDDRLLFAALEGYGFEAALSLRQGIDMREFGLEIIGFYFSLAIPIKCFVSPCPLSHESGLVGWAKNEKKKN